MTSVDVGADERLETVRCAAWTRAEAVDPIATAGSQRGFLLVEHPLPWPRDIGDVPELAAVVAAAGPAGVRLQGVVPQVPGAATRSVVLYERDDQGDGFSAYRRRELQAPAAEVAAAALALLAGTAGDGDGPVGGDGATVDLLVCTHGRRDVCCGSAGTALAVELAASRSTLGEGVRLSRTSHTGGHRFAPTALVLPQGTAWAFLDAEALTRIISRRGPLPDLLARYRGCTGLASRPLQVLERAAFAEVGWDWLDWRRTGEDRGDGSVRLVGVAPDGTTAAWEGEVAEGRRLPVPDCGHPISEAKKSETELVLRSVRRA